MAWDANTDSLSLYGGGFVVTAGANNILRPTVLANTSSAATFKNVGVAATPKTTNTFDTNYHTFQSNTTNLINSITHIPAVTNFVSVANTVPLNPNTAVNMPDNMDAIRRNQFVQRVDVNYFIRPKQVWIG